jgi:dipeptidyl aminopeptidase/acylaminoacyl peptidase
MGYSFERFAAVRRQGGSVALSPDGRDVFYTVDTSGQFNVWRQRVQGGWPYQLTLFEDWAARSVAASPAGDLLAVAADKDGAERFQVFLVPAGGGEADQITDRMDVQYLIGGSTFSPDGSKLLFAGNETDPTQNDVIVFDVQTRERRVVADGLGLSMGASWSPDGRSVLVFQTISNSDTNLYLVDLDSGERRHLTPHEGEVRYSPGPWLSDGSGLYVVSDEGREFNNLAILKLDGSPLEWVQTPDWDIEGIEQSKDGKTLLWSVNEDGISRVYARTEGGEARLLNQLPQGTLIGLAVSEDGTTAVAQMPTATQGTELYAIDLASGQATQITFGMLGGIPRDVFTEPELIRYPTFDGKQIPAFLFRPKGYEGQRVPAVLSIHGGPEAQERPQYMYAGLYQYLLANGVAVLATNIRGSTGYGKSYQRLVHRDFGGDDLKDMEHAALYLRSLDWVDPERIGVFGGSYGGFATLSCVTRLPEYWAAGVDIVGPSNLVTFAKAVPPTWRSFMAGWVGDPYTEEAFLMERSPITYVENIRCPMLIIQGANDYRVVKAESDQIVESIKSRGGVVEYMVYEDEGHGFTRRANNVSAMRASAEFFFKHFGMSQVSEEVPELEAAAST